MAPSISDLALEIIPSVVANALTSLLPRTQGLFSRRSRESPLASSIAKNETVKTLIQKASARVAQKSSLPQAIDADAVKNFLISPELDSILKQLYSNKLISSSGPGYLSAIREEFTLSLALHLRIS